MTAAWFLRSRQLRWSIRYWIAITGYDINDQSFTNRIYSFYLIIFFALWGLSVLALFSSASAQVIQLLAPLQPALFSVKITSLVLFSWFLWKLAAAAFRCPIRFSAEDALLICSTPTPRRAVVFAWIISDWFTSGVLFWGLAILLGFSLTDISLGRAPLWKDAFLYLSSALHLLLPVLLISSGMLALIWALGCFRLNREHERKNLYLVPLILCASFAPGILFSNSQASPLTFLASPLMVPLMAGVRLADYLPGVGISLLWVVLGVVGLFWVSKYINLSRAAQENGILTKEMTSLAMRAPQAVDNKKLNKNSQQANLMIRLAGKPNETAVLWKQLIRSTRTFNFGRAFEWLLIFGLSLGILSVPDWAARSVLIFFWIIRVNDRITKDIRADLEVWVLYQSLPLRPIQRLVNEIAFSGGIIILLGWISFLAKNAWGAIIIPPETSILLPILVILIAVSGAFDVLRQVRIEHLLTGNLPIPSLLSILLPGLTFTAIVFLFFIINNHIIAVTVSVMISLLIISSVLSLYVKSYQKLGR
jgi:hypothetical protein